MAREKRYRPYRQGGKVVPGMFKAQDGDEFTSPPNLGKVDSIEGTDVNIQQGDTDVNISESNIRNRNVPKRGKPTLYPVGPAAQDTSTQQMQQILQQKLMISQAQQAQKDAALKELLNQMKLQNDSLMQQNELLKTKIDKQDLINSARTTKKQAGSLTTPKRKGGSTKGKKLSFAQTRGAIMGRGGSCLPGKKRR